MPSKSTVKKIKMYKSLAAFKKASGEGEPEATLTETVTNTEYEETYEAQSELKSHLFQKSDVLYLPTDVINPTSHVQAKKGLFQAQATFPPPP